MHLDGQFKWGGCGDDIKFGKKFSKTFTDISLRRAGRKSSSQKLLKVATTADSSTTTDLSSVLAAAAAGSSVIPPPSLSWKMPHIMAAVNMHNNRVGRKVCLTFSIQFVLKLLKSLNISAGRAQPPNAVQVSRCLGFMPGENVLAILTQRCRNGSPYESQ